MNDFKSDEIADKAMIPIKVDYPPTKNKLVGCAKCKSIKQTPIRKNIFERFLDFFNK